MIKKLQEILQKKLKDNAELRKVDSNSLKTRVKEL